MREATDWEGNRAHGVEAREQQGRKQTPWKLLLWTALAGLIFGLIGFGEIAEDWLRVARNSFHKHKASGDIVLVTIDDKSLREVGNWPWPRRTDAQLIDRLTAAGAKRIFFDINFSFASNPADDTRLRRRDRTRPDRVTLFARSKSRARCDVQNVDDRCRCRCSPSTPSSATAASTTITRMRSGSVPYAAALPHGTIPSFAAALANVAGTAGRDFPGRLFDRSAIDPAHIPPRTC